MLGNEVKHKTVKHLFNYYFKLTAMKMRKFCGSKKTLISVLQGYLKFTEIFNFPRILLTISSSLVLFQF